MNIKHFLIVASLFMSALTSGQAVGADENNGTANKAKKGMFLYTPPSLGAPATRVGGGTRGVSGEQARVLVLAPDHTGLTTRAQPTLYWYQSLPTDNDIEITIVDDNEINPLLEKVIHSSKKTGIHSVSLAKLGVTLKKDIEYRWFVALIPDKKHRSNDIITGGTIMLVDETRLGARIPARSTTAEQAAALAKSGIWYDAIDALSTEINKTGNVQLKNVRAELLTQVGLGEAVGK